MESLSIAAVIGVLGLVLGFLVGRYANGAGDLAPRTDAELSGMRASAETALAERLDERKQRIMVAARREGRVVNDDVEELFCISDDTARRYLGLLEEEGRLERRGEGGGTHYVPTDVERPA